MLATNIEGKQVVGNEETVLCEWVSNGEEYIIGFTGTGTYSGNFRLYIVEIDVSSPTPTEYPKGYYIYQTSPSNRTAYIADRAFTIPKGYLARLTVEHDSVDTQTFYGTVLGGGY